MRGERKYLNHVKPPHLRIIACVYFSTLFLYCTANEIDDRCEHYNPEARLREAGKLGNCLSALSDPQFREKFEVCKKRICFIYMYDPTFVRFDQKHFESAENEKRMQLPFRCKSWQNWHRSLDGIAIELIEETSARDDYCVWAGPSDSCTWNAMVDYTAVAARRGYQFAIVGPLLEFPHRKCEHFASGSWLDNTMVIIGKPENMARSPFGQLTEPFTNGAWIVVGVTVGMFIAMCLLIVWRFHVLQGKSLVTAYFIFMGDRAAALAAGKQIDENDLRRAGSMLSRKCTQDAMRSNDLEAAKSTRSDDSEESESAQMDNKLDHVVGNSIDEESCIDDSFLTKFSLATSLFRISLIAFIAMFSLFYEVAVVNFLFQQQRIEIPKSIGQLSTLELRQYCVLKDTGLENIWNNTVNPNGIKFDGSDEKEIPWKRCVHAQECLDWVLDDDNPVQFFVSYEMEGRYLMHSRTNCEAVAIYETRETLHQFNSGWLFNERVPRKRRRELGRELVTLKVNGRLTQLLNSLGPRCKPEVTSSINFPVLLVPILFLVVPSMTCSAVVAMCWRRRK
ncbi:hypothetical protein BWQ96_01392 [Gracilariopsis chorda]|uniref:Uncharacterized protein n=1 Tax=Gracilariopsis chorda TaxID=448386 RepID=A0A2V3J310_9FLOR|nr:hypothetical protein BWQ96_01392 [Gracilariopsis chorda]|eukprot:PXF48836.1 hypothetical protein BWQ96_01392 [Gracilariopsis chorda]